MNPKDIRGKAVDTKINQKLQKKLSQTHISRLTEVEELQETVMNYEYPSIVLFYDQ
jgi:hypothetical protein